MKLFDKIRSPFIKLYYFFYFLTPKGKKEVQYTSALNTMQAKTERQSHVSRRKKAAYSRCTKRGHHKYASITATDNETTIRTIKKCMNCGFTVDKSTDINTSFHDQMKQAGVPIDPQTKQVIDA